MEPYRVFISSIMNRGKEDLAAERQAARNAIDHFSPITRAWAFEHEPASPKTLLDFYIDGVKTCDLFVLIIGQHATKPVQDETQTALDYIKPMLVFKKDIVPGIDAFTLIQRINVKYDGFSNATELQEKLRTALGQHLLALIRQESSVPEQLGDRLARLRKFKQESRVVKILPTVPVCTHNSFTIEEVSRTHAVFQQGGMANVAVPAEAIEKILDTGTHALPVVRLGGRLQWITARKNWYFHPEKPPEPDPFNIGIGREVPREPPISQDAKNLLRPTPLTFTWSNTENLADREVFFDEDGMHFTNAGRVLTCTLAPR